MTQEKAKAIVPTSLPSAAWAEVLQPEDDPYDPKPGHWFWVTDEDGRWLGCAMHVGSNYVEVQAPGGGHARIHASEWRERVEPEPDPKGVISNEVSACRERVEGLLAEVSAITARLGVPLYASLGPKPSSPEAAALALRGGAGADMGGYKKALARAKDEDLPRLFQAIESATADLSKWMGAELLPLKADKRKLDRATGAIEERIFSVELYAGLVEEITLISDGAPAGREEPVHLLQRKCFMDEECLAHYEAGGMEFRDLPAFDAWLASPEHRDRILPFPRCIVSFQVRRETKERDFGNLHEFFQMIEKEKLDKLTFLYIRNGERLYRLSTEIHFGDRLFPDMDAAILRGDKKLYADTFWPGRIGKIISEDEYGALIREEEEHAARVAKLPEKERWFQTDHHPPSRRFEAFTQDSVHYDDIAEHIQGEMKKHNRIVLVLQGLLDRSLVLHPHPPWSLWTPEGFGAGVRLVYDETRALTPGEKPDFEAYRQRLNAKIVPGSACVGQEDFWEQVEAAKENSRMDRSYRRHRDWRPSRYRPQGDPGPGRVARVMTVNHKRRTATFAWERERLRTSDTSEPIRRTLEVPFDRLLCADAYEPGDYRKFFSDPRTRADYLKWAPLLCVAEDYRAGKRQAKGAAPAKPKRRTEEGARRYRIQKKRQALIGKAVRLVRSITMRDGRVYSKGSLFRAVSRRGGDFFIRGIGEDGRPDPAASYENARIISNAQMHDLVVDETVPSEPKDQGEKAHDDDA
jgi:hypothetical protein